MTCGSVIQCICCVALVTVHNSSRGQCAHFRRLYKSLGSFAKIHDQIIIFQDSYSIFDHSPKSCHISEINYHLECAVSLVDLYSSVYHLSCLSDDIFRNVLSFQRLPGFFRLVLTLNNSWRVTWLNPTALSKKGINH